jgi:heme-degrading monooxygenase HmoA
MAVLVILDLPGATTEQYEKVNEVLGVLSESDAPEGLISHAAGVTDEGLLIVDLWESEQAAAAFFARGVDETMAAAGAPTPPGPPRMLPVHNHFQGKGETAGVLMIADVDGLTPDMYDSMTAAMEEHELHGPGHPAVHHVAAVKENGDVLVIDIWESPEAFGEFASEQIAPAGQDAGLASFEPRFVPIHNRLRGASLVS